MIEKLKAELKEAEAVVIGAGAGLSTAAGIEYSGARFTENFKDFTVGFVRALPTLLTLAVVSAVIFLCIFLPIRAARRKRRNTKI